MFVAFVISFVATVSNLILIAVLVLVGTVRMLSSVLCTSVADSGCFILEPGSRIQDPTTATNDKGEKFCCPLFLNHKLKIILFFEPVKKEMCAKSLRIIVFFTPKKLSLSSQNYGFGIRGLGYRIRKKSVSEPWSGVQKGIGSRIRIRNTALFGAAVSTYVPYTYNTTTLYCTYVPMLLFVKNLFIFIL